jgi:hypothetical protein
LEKRKEIEAEKVDLIKAIGECRNKGMIIVNFSSIVNPVIITMPNRKITSPASDEEDYRRYFEGDYEAR